MFLSPTIEKPSENLCFSLLEPMEPLGAPMATPWPHKTLWAPLGPLGLYGPPGAQGLYRQTPDQPP